MQDWKEFNDLKNEGWKANTQDEYTNWQAKVKEWYGKQKLTDWDKEQIKQQLEKINNTKQEFFNKQKNKKQFQPKQSYIFREDEGRAFIKLCETFSQFLEQKMSLSELG